MSNCCPVCLSYELTDILKLEGLPIAINAQSSPADSNSVPKGDMQLVVCNQCTHMFNRAFDPSKSQYDSSYENSLHYSEHFRKHAKSLAEQLVTEYALQDSTVAEAGAGPGHFLELLCKTGVGKAFGYDPSYDSERLGAPSHPKVKLSDKLFPNDGSLDVKMAMSQHVLEHLTDPVELLRILASSTQVQEGAIVYSEVPNGDLMLEHCALWDLIYEHYSFFTKHSLKIAQERAGLSTINMGSSFGDQFLYSVSKPFTQTQCKSDNKITDEAITTAIDFGEIALRNIENAKTDLERYRKQGPVVLWGAGSKGMTYLNLVAASEQISAVIDVNPRKTGFGVPGTQFQISAPEALSGINPKTVLIANPIYTAEIQSILESIGILAVVKPLWA